MEGLVDQNLGYVSISVKFLCQPNYNKPFLVIAATIVPGSIFLPIGLLITGWTAQNHAFWLVPDIVSDLTMSS
jgi:hypothetical protein